MRERAPLCSKPNRDIAVSRGVFLLFCLKLTASDRPYFTSYRQSVVILVKGRRQSAHWGVLFIALWKPIRVPIHGPKWVQYVYRKIVATIKQPTQTTLNIMRAKFLTVKPPSLIRHTRPPCASHELSMGTVHAT